MIYSVVLISGVWKSDAVTHIQHTYSFLDSYLLKAKHWLLGEGIVENKKLKKMGKEAIALCLAHQPQ